MKIISLIGKVLLVTSIVYLSSCHSNYNESVMYKRFPDTFTSVAPDTAAWIGRVPSTTSWEKPSKDSIPASNLHTSS